MSNGYELEEMSKDVRAELFLNGTTPFRRVLP